MTETELQHVRLLIAEARAETLKRQNDELDRFFDVAVDIANFYRQFAPAGTVCPEELRLKIEALDPSVATPLPGRGR